MNPRRAAPVLAVLVLASTAGAAAPPVTTGLQWQPHIGDSLPSGTALRDSNGTAITLGELTQGRPTILDLGYFHCPSLCGVGRDSLLAALAESRLRAGRDYTLLDLSISPSETPAEAAQAKSADLARYAGDPGAATAWHYVTADAAAAGAITRAVGFPSRWDATLQQYLHPTGIVIAAPDGRISAYLLGVGYQPGDLRAAIARAQANQVAAPPSPILLLCFHFDQATGRYSFAILKTLRIAAAVTVLGILALLLLLRRARRRHAA